MGKASPAKRKTAHTIDAREQHRDDNLAPRQGVAPIEFAPPLRPRPRLLIVLSVILALWVAFLLVLYFRTVYPYRNDPGLTSQPATTR
jgi:hypothetical protein